MITPEDELLFSEQNSFFSIAGQSIPATAWNGDWWQFTQIPPYVLISIGDLLGHGIQAAQWKPTLQTAYSQSIEKFSKQPPSLEMLAESIHRALFKAAQGTSSLTFFSLLINSQTGSLSFLNAGHVPTYLIRFPKLISLHPKATQPLGGQKAISYETHHLQLQPNDLIFLYTDGLFTHFRQKKELLLKVADLWNQTHCSAHQLCHWVTQNLNQTPLAKDDCTILIFALTQRARF